MNIPKNETAIDCFGGNSFLSPCSYHPIVFRGVRFPTMQHALLAAKTDDMAVRIHISQFKDVYSATIFTETISPGAHWTDEYRTKLLESFINQKFNLKTNPELVNRLKETGDKAIYYINLLNDDFNGLIGGSISDITKTRGKNCLGKGLMKKRALLLKKR